MSLKNHIAALEKENRWAKKDRKRMDWLLAFMRCGNVPRKNLMTRAGIDAAIRAERGR